MITNLLANPREPNSPNIVFIVICYGRHVWHFSESYLRSVTQKTVEDNKKLADEELTKFTSFEVRRLKCTFVQSPTL